jgi:diguanylate cyclase (GGDEF)-like protein/PAS domain S-box-containing protein
MTTQPMPRTAGAARAAGSRGAQPTRAVVPVLLAGIATAVPATTTLAGWLLPDAALIHRVFGATMAFDAALCLLVVASALIAGVLAPGWRLRAHTLAGGFVTVIAGVVLIEHLSGYTVDWPELHRFHIDTGSPPGRMSALTAAGFAACGAALLMMGRVRRLWSGLCVQLLTGAIVAIGGLGVAGYLLQLPLIYPHYPFAPMALMTATGFVCTGAALWLSWRRETWYRSRALIRRSDRRIALNFAAALAVPLFLAVLAMSAAVGHFVQSNAAAALAQRLQDRADLVGATVTQQLAQAALVASRPVLIESVAALDANPADAPARDTLKARARSFLQAELSGLAIASPEGSPWFSAGMAATNPAVELPLRGRTRASLVWDGGFVLRAQLPITRNEKTVGIMTSEQRLPGLTSALQARDALATGEFVLCARRESQIDCIAPRAAQPEIILPLSPETLLNHGLDGGFGKHVEADALGQTLIAAHGSIGTTGVGILYTAGAADLYAPMRDMLHLVLGIGALVYIVCIALLYRNVTPLVRELALGEQRLQLAVSASQLGQWEWDAATNNVQLSEGWESMLGRPARSVAVPVENLLALVHPDDRSAVSEHLRAVVTGRRVNYNIEHRVRAEGGGWKWICSRGRVTERSRKGRVVHMIGTNADITLRKTDELKLVHRPSHDPLAALADRGLLDDRLAQAIERARRTRSQLALMCVAIDKFESVNDTLGHGVGDALLQQFAARLSVSVRATDFVGRLRGDAFGVVLETLDDPSHAQAVADKIVTAIRVPFLLGKLALDVTTSIGIAFGDGRFPSDSVHLLKAADQAVARAQIAGGNRVESAGTTDDRRVPEPAAQPI